MFLDETFVKSSNVRRYTNVENTKLLQDTHLSSEEHKRLLKEQRSFKRIQNRPVLNPQAPRFKKVSRMLNDAKIDIKPSINNYKFVYPLSKKTVIQYDEKKHDLITQACERLDAKEKRQVKILRDGELVDYCKTIEPTGKYTLETKLSPYYARHKLTVEEIMEHNELTRAC